MTVPPIVREFHTPDFHRERAGLDAAAGPLEPGVVRAVSQDGRTIDGVLRVAPPWRAARTDPPFPALVAPLEEREPDAGMRGESPSAPGPESSPGSPPESGGAAAERAAGPAARELRFGRTADGRQIARLAAAAGTSLYGTGEQVGSLERSGRVARCWNVDYPYHQEDAEGLYQSHPWVLGVRRDGSAFGLLAETTWRVVVDLRQGVEFRSEGPCHPMLVLEAAHPEGVLRLLAELIGRMPMPPLWALGYQQSRWSYETQDRVLSVARGFRDRRIPCDAVWVDIDAMDRFRVFTRDEQAFPDPAAMHDSLHAIGFRAVWMVDPGISADEGYGVYEQGRRGDHYVQLPGGQPFAGKVWPERCCFPDFTRPETRAWWAGLYAGFLEWGMDGVWNDMNEPSVFDSPTSTMPEICWHRGGSLGRGPDPLPAGPHTQYHNVYGMLMSMATREGILRARPGKRPFVLTRSTFIGGQRYAAMWTGDNTARWSHLSWSIPMALNMGLSGQPFAGPDIGGFHNDKDEDSAELYARWVGVGALLPFARAHCEKGSPDKEPWSYGAACEATCRRAIERRYRLLPYLYTVFEEASRTGLPVARPAFFAATRDTAMRTADDQFLLGADLLVRCDVTRDRRGCRSPLPVGPVWRVLELSGETHDPVLPELRIRSGAIVPAGPVMQHTQERPLDPLELYVSLDGEGRASGVLYEDAGDGYAFERGEFLRTRYEAWAEGDRVTVRVAEADGSLPRPRRRLVVHLVTDTGVRTAEGVDGEALAV